MECSKCSKDGDIVYMTIERFDEKTHKNSLECPKCGKEEITGFGIL